MIEPCLTHRIPYEIGPNRWSLHVGPVQQARLSIQVHEAPMATSKTFGTWIPCISLSVTTLVLSIWFHNLRTTSGSSFWPLCSAHALRHFQSGSAQLAILTPPCLWFRAMRKDRLEVVLCYTSEALKSKFFTDHSVGLPRLIQVCKASQKLVPLFQFKKNKAVKRQRSLTCLLIGFLLWRLILGNFGRHVCTEMTVEEQGERNYT